MCYGCILSDEMVDEYSWMYYKEGGKRIKRFVDAIVKKHFGEVEDIDHFYSAADVIFMEEILKKYDESKGDFHKFAYFTLSRKIKTEMTRINRDKRTPYLRDKNGNKTLDRDNKPVRMSVVSLNVSYTDEDDGECLVDTLEAKEEIDNEITNPLIIQYLNKLSKKQLDVIKLLCDGYSPVDVRRKLRITKDQYDDRMLGILSYENTKILKSLIKQEEEKND